MLLATRLLQSLPQATRGAILVFIAGRLFRVRVLRSILRFDRLEFGLAVITMLTVSLVGIEQGVVLAMLLALADRTRRAAGPVTSSSAASVAPSTGSRPTSDAPPSRCPA